MREKIQIHNDKRETSISQSRNSQTSSNQISLRHARQFIDLNFEMRLTIEQASKYAALSPYHFIRVFRMAYRQTPHQYLMSRRIQKAKDLLRTTDLPITEICAAVGFESLGSFSALFRKVAGLSPSAYRRSAAGHLQFNRRGSYIPLCVCIQYGLHDLPDR